MGWGGGGVRVGVEVGGWGWPLVRISPGEISLKINLNSWKDISVSNVIVSRKAGQRETERGGREEIILLAAFV